MRRILMEISSLVVSHITGKCSQKRIWIRKYEPTASESNLDGRGSVDTLLLRVCYSAALSLLLK
jgi:hypothetical protein